MRKQDVVSSILFSALTAFVLSTLPLHSQIGIGSGAGGSGTPGGSTTQAQYNNAGAFGGISGVTTNGTTMSFGANDLILSGVTGSTQCLQASTAGVVTGTGAVCGGSGGTPGGANTNIQFNNSSAFGGDSGFTYLGTGQVGVVNSTANTVPLTISGGSITGSSTVAPGVSVTGTLNTTGIVAGASFFSNLTNTASGTGTTLADFQVASASKFNVDRFGFVRLVGATYGAGNSLFNAGAGFSTSTNYMTFASGNSTGDFEIGSGGCTCIAALNNLNIGISLAGSQQIPDVVWHRGGAANWQSGAANSATPIAQTLQAQGSRPGTDTNIGGGNYTITSGNGTGTGTLSSLILQSPIAVGSGTGAQTQTTGLTIKGGTAVLSGYTVSGLPASPTTGAMAYVTDAVACTFLATVTGGGSTFCPVIWTGAAWQGS